MPARSDRISEAVFQRLAMPVDIGAPLVNGIKVALLTKNRPVPLGSFIGPAG
jgi:hypothetical protein